MPAAFMTPLHDLVQYCDQYLDATSFRDYCPNGLQVEGRGTVRHLVSGVTASQALIEAAIEVGADALLVHHGYFWKGEDARVTGMKRRRLQLLLQHDISLIAYHLPLDAHDTVGNNAQLAQRLGLAVQGRAGAPGEPPLLFYGVPDAPLTAEALADRIASRLGRRPQHIAGAGERIARLAWCTGAAQGHIEQAVAQGVDAFISGEISEPTVHVARECGIHYFAAGHHATERYGVQALGSHLAEQFDLHHRFIDIDNPV
jgi:dinuclear metal center YbgI/SA1388 family protein